MSDLEPDVVRASSWWRLLPPALAMCVLAVLARTPLVGVQIPAELGAGARDAMQSLSILLAGATPIVEGAIVVEILARLVPRLRPLRFGGLEGRAKLRRAAMIGSLVLAALKGVFVALWLRQTELDQDSVGWGLRFVDERVGSWLVPLIATQLLATTAFLWWLASALDRFGLGTGFGWIVGFSSATELAGAFSTAHAADGPRLGSVHGAPELTTTLLLGVAAALFLGFVATRRRLPSGARAMVPVAGVAPLVFAPLIVNAGQLAARAAGADVSIFVHRPALLHALTLGVLALLTFVLGREFVRFRGGSEPGLHPSGRAVLGSIAWLGLVYGAEVSLHGRAGFFVDLVPLLLVPGLVLDLLAEARCRATHGELVCVAIPSCMPDVDDVEAQLGRHGIPHVVRSAHQRSFFHILAPLYETQVLVPVADGERADAILRGALGT